MALPSYEEMLNIAYEKLTQDKKSEESVRLEVPEIKSTISGNKTVIYNLEIIAKAIRRDIDHLFKFLLRELATTGIFKNSEAHFVGKFKQEQLAMKINKYVKEFVLCKQCNKPDTHLEKTQIATFLVCEACGAKESVRTLK
ncbi:MAG: translation initiation factor IF-2 subunit beta [Candidatus Nanoarchaeia archaeon]